MCFVHLNPDFLKQSLEFKSQFLDFDKTDEEIQNRLYIKILIEGSIILVPLRREITNLKSNSALKDCYFEVPSKTRPNAGLDFTKAILVCEEDILPSEGKLASSQKNKIRREYDQIERMYKRYYEEFKRSLAKGRTSRDQKFKYCTLRSLNERIIL